MLGVTRTMRLAEPTAEARRSAAPNLLAPRGGFALLALLLALVASGCVYDSDEPCAHGRVLAHGACACPDGTMENGNDCVPLAVVVNPPGGLGLACDSSSKPCTDATFSTCHIPDGKTEGYCTKTGCASNADCGGAYACVVSATPAYCKAPPTGEGMTCASEDGCKDYEANYCTLGDPAGAKCVVANCVDDTDCSPGRACIDIAKLASIPGLPKQCLLAQ